MKSHNENPGIFYVTNMGRCIMLVVLTLVTYSCTKDGDNNSPSNQPPANVEPYFKIKMGADPARTYISNQTEGYASYNGTSNCTDCSYIHCFGVWTESSFIGARLEIWKPGTLGLGNFTVDNPVNSSIYGLEYGEYSGLLVGYGSIAPTGITVNITRLDASAGGLIEGTFTGRIGRVSEGLSGNVASYPVTGDFRVIKNY